ncbi:MAG: hypothetical protein ACRD2U_06350 [Terriglobales bacterium]
MQVNRNVKLPSELWSRMAETARVEGKTVDELLEEAVLRLLQRRELRSFVAKNQKLAGERGLTETDVSRLIAESRRDNREP